MNRTNLEKKSKTLQIILLVLVLTFFGITAWYFYIHYGKLTVNNLEKFIESFGTWAPIAMIVLYIISSPIPMLSPFMAGSAGLLFGTIPGTLLVIFAQILSSFIPFYLARSLGQQWVSKRIKKDQLKEAYEKSEGQGGLVFILLMRLIPVLPWEIQNYIAGLTKVKVPAFLLGTLIGTIPGSFALAFLGDAIKKPGSWQFFAAIGAVIIAFIIPAAYVFLKQWKKKRMAQEGWGENTSTNSENQK